MNTPHTPGPWAIDSDVSTDVIRMDGSRDCVGVADCMSFNGPEIEECKANARLIAASPELLAALQNLENDDGSIPDHAWKLVQDAITKATGQTP